MSQGPFCEKCQEFTAITTFFPEIISDQTQYTITLQHPDPDNIEHIKTLSKIMNVNFLKSKEMLSSTDIQLFQGKAYDAKDIVDLLDATSTIKYKISPKYKY